MKRMFTKQEWLDYLIQEENEKFSGWDFSYLESTGRMQEFPLRWNYRNRVLIEMNGVTSLLDMGTGGGEFLSSLQPFPSNTCATEGYDLNLEIAKRRLEPLGIKVFKLEDDKHLPFADDSFELVINRHESYDPDEVSRILKCEGMFITQQVGGFNDKEIHALLKVPESPFRNWNLKTAREQLKNTAFTIVDQNEDIVKTRFYDIGAIVFYLKAIPWQVPDFKVETYIDPLMNMQNLIERDGYIDFTCHRFFIIAKK